MSTHATASFVRRELATALRKGPYSVNMLIAGCDSPGEGEVAAGADASSAEPALYWMDYLGACRKVPFGAHGYCGYFIMSTFDRYYREGLNLDEAFESSVFEEYARHIVRALRSVDDQCVCLLSARL